MVTPPVLDDVLPTVLAARPAPDTRPLLVGVTGGVAVGKSTFSQALAPVLDSALGAAPGATAVVATDGFLFDNATLADRGLTARKGFPESYDAAALLGFVAAVGRRDGAITAPVYSHRIQDVVPGASSAIGDAPAVVLEGLHLGHPDLGLRPHLDVLVHLEADDADAERWFLERFRDQRAAAATDPGALLHGVAAMPADAIEPLALEVWRTVNLVVQHTHVRPHIGAADLVVHLGADHAVERVIHQG